MWAAWCYAGDMAGELDRPDRPAVDERLIMPETRWEVIDGKVVYVSPSDPVHGSCHSKLQALLEAHVDHAFNVACDMLTRTSEINDFAPDASIYPRAPHPKTGGRQLEHLVFEVVSTQTLANAGHKAATLIERGVRRAFALDTERERGLEWSTATDSWEILAPDAVIEDEVLAAPLPIRDLVSATTTDNAVARALLHKGNPVLRDKSAKDREEGRAKGREEGRADGLARAVVEIVTSRGDKLSAEHREKLFAIRNETRLVALLRRVAAGEDLDL